MSLALGLKLILAFIDFRKAFDSLSRKALYDTLIKIGMDSYWIHWIMILSENFVAKFILKGGITSDVPVESGVPQGGPLSPLLFSLSLITLIVACELDNDEIEPAAVFFADDGTFVATRPTFPPHWELSRLVTRRDLILRN